MKSMYDKIKVKNKKKKNLKKELKQTKKIIEKPSMEESRCQKY